MAKNAIERAKELFNQFTSGVGSFVQRGQVGAQGVTNTQPINYGQVAQNVGNFISRPITAPNIGTSQPNFQAAQQFYQQQVQPRLQQIQTQVPRFIQNVGQQMQRVPDYNLPSPKLFGQPILNTSMVNPSSNIVRSVGQTIEQTGRLAGGKPYTGNPINDIGNLVQVMPFGTITKLIPKGILTDAVTLAKKTGSVEEFTASLAKALPKVRNSVNVILKDTKNPINTIEDFFNVARGEKPVVNAGLKQYQELEGLMKQNGIFWQDIEKSVGRKLDEGKPLDIGIALQNVKNKLINPTLSQAREELKLLQNAGLYDTVAQNKYYISKYDNNGKQMFAEATSPHKVDIESGLDTFVSKSGGRSDFRNKWVVTEAKTGMAISRESRTQAEAIASAKEVIANQRKTQGTDILEKQLQKAIEKYGTTPRYQSRVAQPTTQGAGLYDTWKTTTPEQLQNTSPTKLLPLKQQPGSLPSEHTFDYFDQAGKKAGQIKYMLDAKNGAVTITSIKSKVAGTGAGTNIVQGLKKWAEGNGLKLTVTDAEKEALPYWQKQGVEIKNLFPEQSRVAQPTIGGVKNIIPETQRIDQLTNTQKPISTVSQPEVLPQPQMGQTQGLLQKKPLLKLPGQPEQPYNADSIVQKVKDKVNSIYTASLDRFHPISQLSKKAGKDQEMQNALTGYYGTGSIGKYHTDFELSPILKSANVDDLRSYTTAQRDLELAGRNIQGSNVGDASKIIEELKAKYGGNIQQLDQAATKLYDYQKNLVQKYLVDTGIISKENFASMTEKNQKYVPFQRVMDEVNTHLGVPPTKGAGSVGSQNVIKGIKGSERQIKDPLESIIENTYKIVGLGKRQQVAQTIVGLKDKLPQGMIKPFMGEVGNKPIISVFENGKAQKYLVPPEIADAAKGLSEQGMNILVKILGAPTRVFRQTATGANPEFALPNISRDIQSAFVNIGLNPLKFVSGLAHYMKKDAVYQEFLKSGGLTSRISLDQPFLKQSVKDLTGIKSKGLRLLDPRRIYNMLQAIGQASEQPTRIASFQKAYSQALKQGLSTVEARSRGAYAAQEATVNFARRGSVTQPINSIYAFLNARAQGVDRLIRTIKSDPVGASFRIGAITVAPALGLYAYNRNFQSYSDPRVVPDYEKQNNFIIMLSDTPISALGGAQYIKIPKGDIGKIANPLEAFMAYADGKGGDVGSALKSVLTGFSPISNIGDLIPTALRPPIENAANYSFFQQRPLVSESKKNYPAQYQFDKSTPAIYKEIGARLNQSPAKIANLIRGYLTGFARIGEMITQPFAKQDTYSGQDVNKTPVVRRFLGGAVRTQDEQALNDYFQQKGILDKVQDIKTGIKYGNIPLEDGMNEINKLLDQTEKLQTQQQSYLGPRAAAATNVTDQRSKLAEDKARLQIQLKGGTQLVNDKFFYTNDNGSVVSMDLSPIKRPKLTGYEDIDKVLTSKYSSRLTTEINNLIKLAELGQITYQQASELIKPIKAEQEQIKLSKPKTYKPKAIKARRVTVRKTAVPKPIKLKIKTNRVKLRKYKPLPRVNFKKL